MLREVIQRHLLQSQGLGTLCPVVTVPSPPGPPSSEGPKSWGGGVVISPGLFYIQRLLPRELGTVSQSLRTVNVRRTQKPQKDRTRGRRRTQEQKRRSVGYDCRRRLTVGIETSFFVVFWIRRSKGRRLRGVERGRGGAVKGERSFVIEEVRDGGK